MKGAFLISTDPLLAETARRVISEAGGSTFDETAQWGDDQGRLLTVFLDTTAFMEGLRAGLRATTEGTALLAIEPLRASWIECRWEDLFAEWVRRIAVELTSDAWVLDDNDTLWPALGVDPRRVRL